MFEYRGWKYDYMDDIEPEENCKRFHQLWSAVPDLPGEYIYEGFIPLSPYVGMSESLFKRWIEMGKPTRKEMGGHHIEHHTDYYNMYVDKKLDKILLGEE